MPLHTRRDALRVRRFPTLERGPTLGDLRRDKTGRPHPGAKEERTDIGDNKRQSPIGGMPRPRDARAMVPHLLEAAQQMKIPPQRAVGPGVINALERMGRVPQRMAKTFGTANPKQQAFKVLDALRQRGNL